jgi:hypothetical protein
MQEMISQFIQLDDLKIINNPFNVIKRTMRGPEILSFVLVVLHPNRQNSSKVSRKQQKN